MRCISRPIIPDYLNSIGRGDLIGPALTALKVGQLPDSLLLLVLASRIGRRLAWDLSGLPSRPSARSAANTAHPASAFIPVALGAVTMTCLAPTLGVSRKRVPG
jgi:hypothetical protein